MDKQIAATALIFDLFVLSRNTAHYAPTGVRLLDNHRPAVERERRLASVQHTLIIPVRLMIAGACGVAMYRYDMRFVRRIANSSEWAARPPTRA